MKTLIATALLSLVALSGAANAGGEVNDGIRTGAIVGTHGILGAR